MSRAATPVLTIRYNGAERTFAAGNDVVIGRDLRADVRVADPLISRAHVLVRFDQDRWVAVDNGSLNGLLVNHQRVPTLDIQDGQRVNIGDPDGPALTFEVGRHQGAAGRPPETVLAPIIDPPTGPQAPVGGRPRAGATSMMKILRPGRGGVAASAPGGIKIGRSNDNDIVIPEVLASRHHATLIQTANGTETHDNRSINGTFVNGTPIGVAMLREGDVVTIGNIDLVFANGTLARRQESLLETRTGGLDVHGVTWTIEGNKTLLDNISIAARPGMLTAVIGPSGAGKSTFAKLADQSLADCPPPPPAAARPASSAGTGRRIAPTR